jgi:hypothetical protein
MQVIVFALFSVFQIFLLAFDEKQIKLNKNSQAYNLFGTLISSTPKPNKPPLSEPTNENSCQINR